MPEAAFRAEALDFLEAIFFADATHYGFFGTKLLTEMTATIPKRDTYKVLGSGHYLYKGKSLELYRDSLLGVPPSGERAKRPAMSNPTTIQRTPYTRIVLRTEG